MDLFRAIACSRICGSGLLLVLALAAPAPAQVSCADPDNLCTGDPCVISTLEVIYDESGPATLVLRALVPAGGFCRGGSSACWRDITNGVRYRDDSRTPKGPSSMRLKAGRDDAAKITLRASGPNVNFPALPLGVPCVYSSRPPTGSAGRRCTRRRPSTTVPSSLRAPTERRLQSSRANQSDTTGSAGPESV
jgi:hypothetical protein